jgi:DNA modification methylase
MSKLEPLVWRTEKRRVNDLLPYEKNPKKYTEKEMEDLKTSCKKFNIVESPAINIDGKIVAGHMRIKALQLLGRGEEMIDVRIPNRKLTPSEFKQYLLNSNRLGGSWDFDILASDFDIGTLLEAGFDSSDLSSIFDNNLEVEDDHLDLEKELEEAKTTDIKSGDLFSFGKHRLICSDSTNPETVRRLVSNDKVSLLNIDFPYNINLSYNAGLGGNQNYGGTINDNKSDVEYKEFLTSILRNAMSVTKDDCHVFAWLDEKYIGTMQDVYKSLNIEFKRLCLWAKGAHNPTPQVGFNRCVELCMYGIKGRPFLSDKVKNLTEFQNKEIGTGNRLIDDIMDLFQLWLVKRLPANEYEHPTMKPPTLYEKSLRRCSQVGDIVLDLTAGSGSLMVASDSLKRRAYLAEIEPIFCQVILNRFKKLNPHEKITKLN